LSVNAPEGWLIKTTEGSIKLLGKNKSHLVSVSVTPPKNVTAASSLDSKLKVSFKSGNSTYSHSIRRILYDHIPNLVSLKASEVKLINVELKSNIRKVGYIEGAGDEVAEGLRQAGIEVEIIDESKLSSITVEKYPVIVTGIRAYNTNSFLINAHDQLMNYISSGGNLIVQYNTNSFLGGLKAEIGPYPFTISRERVTDETATPLFLKPDHFLFNSPNKISASDFEGWVQERGLYFAGEASQEYEKIISWNDPGEKHADGGLLIAKKGKGYFMYTGISFFRQIPAGVPGAYKLLLNLINAGK
jgi:hypothetical protein